MDHGHAPAIQGESARKTWSARRVLASREIETITSDKVRELHGWWSLNAARSGVPDRGDFDPTAFARLLPNMLISEIHHAPFRIRYRLIGTKVADVLNVDFTGHYLDELIETGSDTPWMDHYRQAYANRQPVMGQVTEPTTAGDTFTFEFGIFPVTAGGPDIRQFLCIEDYFGFNRTSAELMPWSFRKIPPQA
jgi:hypothetical protein